MWVTVVALLPLFLVVKAHSCHGGGKDGIATLKDHSCPANAYKYGSSGFVKSAISGSGSPERLPLGLFDNRSTYMFRVENGLSPGQTVHISGKTSKEFRPFAINFLLGKPVLNEGNYAVGTVANHIKNTIAFQLRVEKRRIITNFLMDGKVQEGKGSIKGYLIPLKPGQQFDIRIKLNLYAFEIYLNGRLTDDMYHVTRHCAITYINVDGDVELTDLHLDNESNKTILKTPFEAAIPGGHLNIGDRVTVYGRLTNNWFNINFVDAKNNRVFHFNPRKDWKAIILNTERNQQFNFQKEENKPGFPFDSKKEFKIEFVNEKAGIAIYIDGVYLTTYAHRVNGKTDYKKLTMFQDIEVHRVEICKA
uniref:Galectin n=1 Tax=Panagrellus redivivus TaxID=6233 RepID=A0A7E4VDR9_PANRE